LYAIRYEAWCDGSVGKDGAGGHVLLPYGKDGDMEEVDSSCCPAGMAATSFTAELATPP